MAPVTGRRGASGRTWRSGFGTAVGVVCVVTAGLSGSALFAQNRRAPGDGGHGGFTPPAGAAYELRDIGAPAPSLERGGAVLDTPVLPGSVIKVATLAAALESGALDPRTTRLCRRVVSVDGRTYTCSHPDLGRPLTPAEALAHSCNDFFIALAPRLSRDAVNTVRTRAGLPAVAASTPLAAALVGLDGPRVTPRRLADAVARLIGVGPSAPVPMRAETRQVLRDGLRGAAEYGTASAFADRRLAAFAKTGTAPMPGGGSMGLVIAFTPAAAPARRAVVVAPGAAGLDAAAIAADLVASHASSRAAAGKSPAAVDAAHGLTSSIGLAAGRADAASQPAVRPRDADRRSAERQPQPAQTTVRVGRVGSDGRARAAVIDLDDYVAEVLAGEAQTGAPDTSLRALAIAVRTYALANRARHADEGFDLCDTTHCQVARPSTPRLRAAAAATSGQVLLKDGRLASVFHSAWCGGHPERASDVWPGSRDDAGIVVQDDACSGEPAWRAEVRAGDLERALRAAGLRGGPLRDVRIAARTRTGRVARVHIEGWSPAELSGQEFRNAIGRGIGWQFVKSTAFDLTRTGQGYVVTGRGFGHGVGLCVLGAGRRAMRGDTADAILRFYFPGLAVGRVASGSMSEGPVTASSAARGVVVTPHGEVDTRSRPGSSPALATKKSAGAAPVSDIALALPAGEFHEREALEALIRRVRDRVASAAAVPPPALRITVHPTVESFARATGQSWLVAGATSGHTIDLLPVTALRRAGRLERVVTHEVAHAVVDEVLARRALWVREGAAAYFASRDTRAVQSATGDPRARRSAPDRPASGSVTVPRTGPPVICPADRELRQPRSAAALADAYARAESCFRQALARGRDWRDVE